MSQKQAKKLRRLVREVVAGKLAKGEHVSDETLYIEIKKNQKLGMIPGKLGEDPTQGVIASGTVLTTPGSVRGIYKALKKNLSSNG